MTPHTPYLPRAGVGDVISQSFALLRGRPGLHFGLGGVSAAATLLSSIAMFAVFGMGWNDAVMAMVRQDVGRLMELMLAWLGIVILVSLAAGVLNLVVSGLLVRLSGESLNDRRPSLSDLLGTAGGFATRVLPLAALGLVIYLGVMGLVFLPMLGGMATLTEPSPDFESIGAGVLISFLLLLPVALLAVFFGVRLLYLLQVVSLEELGGMAALRRTWSLTAGVFWRTFGTVIVAGLLVYAVTMVVGMGTQFVTMGALSNLETANPLSPEFLTQMLGAIAVPVVAQTVLEVATVPFLQAVVTVMYVNRTRELAPAAGAGYPMGPYGHQPTAHGYQPMPYPTADPYGQGMRPPQGYAPPATPPGYGPVPPAGPGWPPQGPPPQGYGPPPHAYGQHPQGYGQPPQGYGPAPHGYGQPPQSSGQPPQGHVPGQPYPSPWQPPAGQQPPSDRQG